MVEQGSADDGEHDATGAFREPPPPDDRLWRHPTELAAPPPRRRPSGEGAIWAVGALSGLVASVLTFGLVAATGALDRDDARTAVVREAVPAIAPANGDSALEPVVRIAEDVSPAIARIEVSGASPGTGSGVVFRDDGYLLTNAHVVDAAEGIKVVLADGSEHSATLVGADALTDVAVIKIEGEPPFRVAVLGSAGALRVGQATVAIGSPLGLIGGSSVTTGVVSALGRRVPTPEGPPLLDMIQTDAAIAPGSSGGALLDVNGSVIGITTAIAVSNAGAEGLGFATPIDIARSVADDIIATGRAVHVWLGIEGRDLDAASADASGIDGGAVVVNVVDASPADHAGLVADDVIVSISGTEVPSMSALVIALRDREPGEHVELEVLRGQERSSVDVQLTSRPSDLE
ncbi:MAG TPA: trypsin-like peptidase domain-containing protein [Acidimicrobiales bacterium]|nr:trypsin-like peptidase domain-containing protein [Acidimicrobiales bacterium]